MVEQCVNPDCQQEFKRSTSGELYALDRLSAETEFFWLCSICASHFVVCLEPEGRVGMRSRAEFISLQQADPERHLRLVSPRSVRTPQVEAGRPRRMTLSAKWGHESLCHIREVA